jgi:hypothetical protein
MGLIQFGSFLHAGELKLQNPPIVKSINLGSEGVIAEFDFEIKEHWIYRFEISFTYPIGNKNERNRVRKIIGEFELDKNNKPIEPGILTPLNISIFKQDTNSIIYQKSITPVLTSWGSDDFGKNIGHCDLIPGKYTVLIRSYANNKQYESIPTFFVIGMEKFKVSFDTKKIDRSKTWPQ